MSVAPKGMVSKTSFEFSLINKRLSGICVLPLYVMKEDNNILGVAGLHVLGQDLAEIRSLVVSPDYAGKGIGRKLVNRIISDAPKLGISRVMSFTYETEFFKKCGFKIVARETLPEKVWVDCMNCPKLDCCDEVAMIKYVG